MREYCADNKLDIVKSYPSYERLRNGLPTYVWMASPRHNLFYCATPKCASTTWKTYILEDAGLKWKGDNHAAAASRIGVKKMFTERKTNFMPFLEKYRPANRLVIVRNPWARLVSAYEDKIVHTRWQLKTLCVAGINYPTNRSTIIPFSTLIDCLTTSNRKVIWNAHINPFTSLCGFCYMDYNIIVKMEEMAEAEPFIKQKLNFSKTELHYKPRRKGKFSNTYASYYRTLTDNHIKKLQDIYKDDIELFGYPRTPFE
ncbi:carbohydrate sulfotransferase 12-like isoform X2 [Watersipora subatra]